MKFYLSWLVLAFFLALGSYFASGRLSSTGASGEVAFLAFFAYVRQDILEDEQTQKAEITLRVLTENCGKCHRSTLPTAESKALAIFDLDQKPWHTSVSDRHLEGISRRISIKSGISDADRAAVLDFIAGLRQEGRNEND